MITDAVIKEIYKKYGGDKKDSDIRLDFFVDMLSPNHNITVAEDEIILENLEEFNPFRRFLLRSINAILEFDKMVVFVFRGHLLFFNKENAEMRVHLKPEEKKSWIKRIFKKNY